MACALLEKQIYWVLNKQLFDEVFVICGIINVEVRVITYQPSRSRLTLTETLIILHITKTESDNCFIIHCNERIDLFGK